MPPSDLAVRTAAQLESLGRVDAYLARQMEVIPEAGDDVVERMMEVIALAESIEDIDAPWNSNGLGEYADHVITLRGLKKIPSDYKNTCGWFLVVDALVRHDSSEIVLSTSSRLTMQQLLTLYTKGWMPCDMIPRYSRRATKAGYYPMHLDLHRGEPLKPSPRGPVSDAVRRRDEQLDAQRRAEREAMIAEQRAADTVDGEVVAEEAAP